jgi:hypothetical protein
VGEYIEDTVGFNHGGEQISTIDRNEMGRTKDGTVKNHSWVWCRALHICGLRNALYCSLYPQSQQHKLAASFLMLLAGISL